MIRKIEQTDDGTISHELPAGLFQEWAPPRVDEIKPDADREMDEKTKKERRFICVFCGNFITSPGDIFNVSGSHRHVFTNPAGVTFSVGTFLNAPGCKNTGTPTSEYSWFPGYTWCFSLCSLCSNHLGWFYQSGSKSFYGLILDNLAENM